MAPHAESTLLSTSDSSLGDTHAISKVSLDDFHLLVQNLSRFLGPSSGLDSSDVDVARLQELMVEYMSKEQEWERYAFQDFSRGYTRNLVDEGNGKSNLVGAFSFGNFLCHTPI